jgi:hypothetical protein
VDSWIRGFERGSVALARGEDSLTQGVVKGCGVDRVVWCVGGGAR